MVFGCLDSDWLGLQEDIGDGLWCLEIAGIVFEPESEDVVVED